MRTNQLDIKIWIQFTKQLELVSRMLLPLNPINCFKSCFHQIYLNRKQRDHKHLIKHKLKIEIQKLVITTRK